jgi:hypothetical protein
MRRREWVVVIGEVKDSGDVLRTTIIAPRGGAYVPESKALNQDAVLRV